MVDSSHLVQLSHSCATSFLKMNLRSLVALCVFLAVGLTAVSAGDYPEPPSEYEEPDPVKGGDKPEGKEEKPDEAVDPEKPVKGPTGVGKPDDGDIVAAKFRGFCHWGPGVYYKPGTQMRCSCMKCTCRTGGNWDCGYHFPYCPYYYCGNQIYNPHSQVCCCGKVHDKKADHRCCGYFYYYSKSHKCCNYYSVKSIKSHCPRDKI